MVATVDLAEPLRSKILATSSITALLPSYLGAKTVFTRRPVPPTSPYPLIVVSSDIVFSDQDGIDDSRPIIRRDVIAYGQNDTAEHYRTVETLGRLLRELFHSKRDIVVTGWSTMICTCLGPQIAPTDDDQVIARVVTLTLWLANPTP